MNELWQKSTIDFKHKAPREVAKRLQRMKIEGKVASDCGEYKKAFIFLKRWLNTITWIKTTKEFKNDAAFFNQFFSTENVKKKITNSQFCII